MNYFSFYKGGKALYCLFFAGFLMSFSSSFGRDIDRHDNIFFQQNQVQGTVTDGSGPLPGVTISIKGKTRNSSITDYNGQYTINALASDTLIVSFIGFKTKFIPVNNSTKIDIKLEYDTTTLQEVRVNAGYYSVKESDRTGSIARITSKDIETQPVTNVLATMQGRMPGVNIIQNTGMPGSGFTIEIRGKNSIRSDGNNPLYIIDGVPYSSQSIGSSYTSTNMPAENSPLNSINPADIEVIEVLKDADATAIYGSRGANGIVLITTKKGRAGKTLFTGSYTYGIGKVTRFKNVLQTPEYMDMRKEAFANDGVTQFPANAYDVNGTWDQNRNADWQKELIGGIADYTNAQASLSGGSLQTKFLLSANYSKETTVFPKNYDYTKAGGHFSLNHESENKKFKINFSSVYTAQLSSLPSADLTQIAVRLPPNAPSLYDANGNLNWENNTFDNPLAPLEGKIKGNTYDFLANALLSYEIGAGFILSCSFGYTDLRQKQLNLQPSTIYSPAAGVGSEVSTVFTNQINRASWIIEPQLAWNKNFGKARMEVLLGSTFQHQKGDRQVNYALGFASNSLMENPSSASSNRVLNSEQNIYRYNAGFTRINLNWDGKYIINLTGRRDGSSRFGPGKKFANFGAVGAGWIFSKEKILEENVSFLSFGKIRGSYGSSGNDQIGDYQYLDTYSSAGINYQGISGLQPSRLFNADFGWETNKKLEFALETGFLNDRIFTAIAWYSNKSSNQLVGNPLPGTTGFTSIQANLDAVVQNKGIEFSLRTLNIKNDVFTWTSTFNFTSNKNKLLSFPGLNASTYKNQYVIGEPLNIVKTYEYSGLNPLTGVYTFKDVNGDGILNVIDDRQTLKNLNPKYFGGFQNQLLYRSVSLDFLFQFVKQANYNENFSNPMPGTMFNQPDGVIAHWQGSGDVGPYQGYSNSNTVRNIANSQFSQSDAAISDASYIRLKNISLSYQLPKEWTKTMMCRLSIQGQNVLTFTRYKGIDPEFRIAGYVPPLRIYSTAIQIIF
ncbi:SusC/RagA family TonB-linked outer membrane protein [Flavobacterium sp. CSZ]|uniref:SusC/RagA family TonB-linked outer membrane protein n=1 Tax=Flavobacterium sp. CSZ TaxID=2783791 RepID=UPI00188B0DDC|nr:SusC/RagA family TonB-linked outer membrane protein [Flavobacterium sp. CSZ]MBF4485796.1 SusC/RagA family TonB-linked outer membrane protein [Flavobacterium sp. CSZ]